MTRIQQVHWEFEMDYIGHPYYVSGNAILAALAQRLPSRVHRRLHASHGMFVPGQFGRFPEKHSQDGSRPYIGTLLPEVEFYDDLFLFRDPAQRWLLDSRPRDALNTHDVRVQGGHPALAHETIMGRPEDAYQDRETTTWYINAYLHADAEPGNREGEDTRHDSDDILPIDDSQLDGLQFGGKRNYGYGTTRLKDTQLVNLDEIDYSRLEDCETVLLELLTPYVLESEYPDADDLPVPWWWAETRDDLREREEKVLEQGEVYRLRTVDHGQVVAYDGDHPIETARNCLCRVGSHSKYGFGELRVKPVQT